MERKIIAIVGMCGSGKSEACKYLEEKGFYKVYFGSLTMKELEKRGLDVNEKNEKMVRENIRKEHGMGGYAVIGIPEIDKGLETTDVLIDGLYSWSEYKILKEKYGENLTVIAIFTALNLRYERLGNRQVRPLSKQDIDARDLAEIENIEKGGPIAKADYTIVNDGTVNDLRSHMDKIMGELK